MQTACDAKELLVERILSQAQRDGISLSDVERKMLCFSENYWTLPDMAEVNEEFDWHYDQGEFERKIASLVRNIQETGDEPAPSGWDEAVQILRREDHYLLVLIDAAGVARSRGHFVKLVLITLFGCIAVVAGLLLFARSG